MAKLGESTVCPVSRSLDIVGDRWTMLCLRELFMGATRFEEIQIQTEATPQMLTSRLKALEANGMVARHLYSEKPRRYEYRLTEKGREVYPVVQALRAWGEKWCKAPDEGVAVLYSHQKCGHDVGLDNVCTHCGVRVERKDLDARLSEKFAKERAQRHAVFKGKTGPV